MERKLIFDQDHPNFDPEAVIDHVDGLSPEELGVSEVAAARCLARLAAQVKPPDTIDGASPPALAPFPEHDFQPPMAPEYRRTLFTPPPFGPQI